MRQFVFRQSILVTKTINKQAMDKQNTHVEVQKPFSTQKTR